MIESYLQPTDVMLEFGAGYSTVWFSQFVKEYYSIEHNATWFDEIKTHINETRKNVHLMVAPVAKGHRVRPLATFVILPLTMLGLHAIVSASSGAGLGRRFRGRHVRSVPALHQGRGQLQGALSSQAPRGRHLVNRLVVCMVI